VRPQSLYAACLRRTAERVRVPPRRATRREMPATSTLVGASLGLGVQFYSNAVRKLPLLRSACPRSRPFDPERGVARQP